MISKQISLLEDKLGARLLHRSTRNAQLTYVGEAYLQRARNILAKIEDADNFVQDLQETSPWEIENQRPMALGLMAPWFLFADFMREYPDIELDIHL